MKFVPPVTVTDAVLTASSLLEADWPAWSAGTAYALADKVIRTSTHRIYQRLVAGTTATAPELDAVNWRDIGPTNKWSPFDGAVGTVATSDAAPTLSYILTPGQACSHLAMLDLSADIVTITVDVPGTGTVYTRTLDRATTLVTISDWYAYWFEPFSRRGTLVVGDLPAYREAVITVIATGTPPLLLGSLLIGSAINMGPTLAGARVGITDYSRKTTDEFGVTTITERAYAKRMSAVVSIATPQVSAIQARLADVRAQPVLWIGEDDIDATVILGWCREFELEMQYPTVSQCSLTVDGLV